MRHFRECLSIGKEVCWCLKGISLPNFLSMEACFYTTCQSTLFKASALCLFCLKPYKCFLVWLKNQAPPYGFGGLTRSGPCLPLPLHLLPPFLAMSSSHAEPLAVPQRCQPCSCLGVFILSVPSPGQLFLAPLHENIQMCVQPPSALIPNLGLCFLQSVHH